LTLAIQVEAVGAFDQKRCGEELDCIKKDLEKRVEQVNPRKGFSFKNKLETREQLREMDIQTMEFVHENVFEVLDKRGEFFEVDGGGKDVRLVNLNDCVVFVHSVTNLHISNVVACLIVAPEVTGSLRLCNAKSCQILIECRQVRIHDSANTGIVVKCKSKPILEGCVDMLWATWRGVVSQEWIHIVSGRWRDEPSRLPNSSEGPVVFVDGAESEWRLVQDFEWLKPDLPSPHWKLMNSTQCTSWPFII
jgi:hypothetical protein